MSTCFKDSKGINWEISLTLASATRVKEHVGVDLLKIDGDETLTQRLAEDYLLIGKIVACLIENQFDKYGVTAENIDERFDAKTINASVKALNEELVNFFRDLGRPDKSKQIEKMNELLNYGISVAEKQADKIPMSEMKQKIDAEAEKAFTNSVGSQVE